VKDEGIDVKVVRTGNTGIRMPNTWHGHPDAMIRTSKYSSTNLVNYGNGSLSPGNSVLFEAKMEKINVAQLIGTCIISSFTEHNLHPSLNPLKPAIMWWDPNAVICIYDCQRDILLLTDPITWLDQEDCDSQDSSSLSFNYTNLMIIWLILVQGFFRHSNI